MNDNGAVSRSEGSVEVSGALTFETVPEFLAASHAWLAPGNGAITVDLKTVTRVDSAGVALLLEWQRLARQAGRQLTLANMPDQVQHMVRVNGLTQAFAANGGQV